eukprot:462646-Hanusia_phi.AAC.1
MAAAHGPVPSLGGLRGPARSGTLRLGARLGLEAARPGSRSSRRPQAEPGHWPDPSPTTATASSRRRSVQGREALKTRGREEIALLKRSLS